MANRRDLSIDRGRELATGQLYIGSHAFELGLVDRLGGIDEAIDYVTEIAGLREPVKYEFSPGILSRIRGFSLQIPLFMNIMRMPQELVIMEILRDYHSFLLRYQVK